MKRVLLAVSGLNPQVITETLYALHMEGRLVNQIHVITTRKGKERIFKTLLAPDGAFFSFLDDYKIPRETVDFSPANIHVVTDTHGHELDDITNAEANEALLKCCLNQTFQLTSQPSQAVYFLVAGGRKTMSSCLSTAAQFYGRTRDRIYHVLVSSEFEACRDFWFPPSKSVAITLFDHKGQPYQKETRYAKVQLVAMPFFSLRDQLSAEILTTPRMPAELMASLIKDEDAFLVIRLPETKIIYGGRELDINPAYLALYAWFAEQKKKCTRQELCQECSDCFVEALDIMSNHDNLTRLYQAIPGSRLISEMSDSGIASLTRENFNSYKSKLRKMIESAFGTGIGAQLEISAVGKKPDTRFGIRLDKTRIRIEW